MTEVMRYVNPKPHPEDVIAVIGFEDWDGLLRGHESLLRDVVQLHEQLNKTKTNRCNINPTILLINNARTTEFLFSLFPK